MRRLLRFLVGAVVLAGAGGVARAATPPVAVLQCDGDLTANLSYYEISVATSAGSGGPSLQPVILHTALTNFVRLFALAATGKHVSRCTLTAKAASGLTIQYSFVDLVVTSAEALGRSPRTARDEPGGMVVASLLVDKVEVTTTGGGDDGGSTGGWDLEGNKAD